MPVFARHFPTMHFAVKEMQGMPAYERGCGGFTNEGWYRSTDDCGKLVVFYTPGFNAGPDCKPRCVVRPIIHVPMGRGV